MRDAPASAALPAQGPVFVYSGNGCQWEGMGRDLLATSRAFAAAVDAVDALFQRRADFSLRAELMGDSALDNSALDDSALNASALGLPENSGSGARTGGAARLARVEIAQPALFAVQVGLTAALRERGLEPRAVTGHSVGEIAAAWAAGALSLDDAVEVVYWRSYYQGLTRGSGQMSAAALGEREARALLDGGDFPGVTLAGINGPRGVTLAGDPDALGRLEARLRRRRIFARRLALDYAFHTSAMDPIERDLVASLAAIRPAPARLRYQSSVTGGELAGSELDARYWWHNIRQPVRFHAAVTELASAGFGTFVEIGPHPILRRYLSDTLSEHARSGQVIATLHRRRPGAQCLNEAVARLAASHPTAAP